MRNQLGRQSAYGVPAKLSGKKRKGPPGEIDRDLGLRLIHRQHKAVAGKPRFCAQRLAQRISECQRTVLDGVMLVDLEITATAELEGKAPVLGELREHVIEEA